MISSFIESLASFSISASKKELSVVVSLQIGRLLASELLSNPVNKNNKSSNFCGIWFNLSGIFVTNVISKLRCQN